MSYHKFSLLDSSFEEIEVDFSKSNAIPTNMGYSLAEWSKKLGFGEKKTSKWLKERLFRGEMRAVKVPIIDIIGRVNYSFVYIEEENGTEE